mgnify:CR=1 FL=1
MTPIASAKKTSNAGFLIFDIETAGHHEGYIKHLVSHFNETSKEGEKLTLAAGKDFIDQLNAQEFSKNILFRPIDEDLIIKIKGAGLFSRSIKEWQLFRAIVKERKPKSALLMYMDTLLLGMLLLPRTESKVTGIYFRPHFHYISPNPKWKTKLPELLKKVILKLTFLKKGIQNLLVLDSSAIDSLKKITGSEHVKVCPDPVESYTLSQKEIAGFRTQYHFPKNDRKVFLIFGYLDKRKGIEATLEAIRLLDPSELLKMHIVIAGTISKDYQNRIEQLLSELPEAVMITTHLEKVTGKAIQFFFEASDVVLAVYQKHIGMSSILVRAAISEKPVIADEYGLLGKLVQEKELGISIDSSRPEELTKAMSTAIQSQLKVRKGSQQFFVKENSVSQFGKVIFETLRQ